ncbi:MAG TPA: C40 family peptidase [Pyrinomonadaceae bacterium]|nr:C40 family peptidase [Pyrinomonadaceae bacterium]
MSFSRIFPRALSLCFALTVFAVTAAAQSPTRPRVHADETQATTAGEARQGRTRLENDLVVAPAQEEDEEEPRLVSEAPAALPRLGQMESLMLAAIEDRLGIPYRMGSEGPTRYDCSGFVWSVFQTAGIPFQRGSARTFWTQFEPVDGDERFKFGTLVFFNHLQHVGIVADEHGFYHASSSKGVVYSRFGEYWSKRITGFRRVPLSPGSPLLASAGR